MENHRSDLRLMDGKKYLLDQYFPSIKSLKKKKDSKDDFETKVKGRVSST